MPVTNTAPVSATARLARYEPVHEKILAISDAQLRALFSGVTEVESKAIEGLIMGPLHPAKASQAKPVKAAIAVIQQASEADFKVINERLAKLSLGSGGSGRPNTPDFRFSIALSGYIFGATMADLLSAKDVTGFKRPVRRLLGWR